MCYRSARCVLALFVAFGSLDQMGCAMAMRSREETAPAEALGSPESLNKTSADFSLFPGDQLVLNDPQIEKIFGTKIGVPENGKLSVVRYGAWRAWYWSEEFARLDQQSLDEFLARLKGVKKLRTVQIVPEMLLPRQMDIPHLRETAARVQADLLLIYRPTSRSYQKSKFLKKDATRAYCTVEAAVLDTRSGVVIYTTRASENFAAEESGQDMNFSETIGRAEQQAVGRAMGRIAQEVAGFLEGGG
jgi:hypothetical protein